MKKIFKIVIGGYVFICCLSIIKILKVMDVSISAREILIDSADIMQLICVISFGLLLILELQIANSGIRDKNELAENEKFNIKKITYVPVEFITLKMDANYIEEWAKIICRATNPVWRINIEKNSFEHHLDESYISLLIGVSFACERGKEEKFDYNDILWRADNMTGGYDITVWNENMGEVVNQFYNRFIAACGKSKEMQKNVMDRCKKRLIEYRELEYYRNEWNGVDKGDEYNDFS